MHQADTFEDLLTAPRPTARQLRWQALEFYAFIHFGMNTMTGCEWGTGDEDPALFDPSELDADQWMAALASAGMKGAVLTAKHHDGFCLWPSKVTSHSVANSPWRGGTGDVVGEVASAARRHGMAFGIYLSPWDRAEATYGSGSAYDDYFVAQLTELLTNYGPIFSVWFDGACGEGPNGKVQTYDWERYYRTIRELQPMAVISVCGPDTRWCGNEAGHTRPDEWSVVPGALRDVERIAEKSQQVDDGTFSRLVRSDNEDLGSRKALAGLENDLVWYPAEVNTSIRPGWFYHEAEDAQVRTVGELVDIYRGSVGGNATLMLNVPPDRRGQLAEPDVVRLGQLGERIRQFRDSLVPSTVAFSSGGVDGGAEFQAAAQHWGVSPDLDPGLGLANGTGWWQPDASDPAPTLTLRLASPERVDTVVLKEEITLSQRIEGVVVRGWLGEEAEILAETACVGYQRILTFAPSVVDRVTVEITRSRGTAAIAGVGVARSAA